MLVARRFVLSGRVQGVGFRFFAEAAAHAEGLHGWVRNLDDGRVEVLAEGDLEALDRFESKMRRGPASARIQHVEAHDEQASGRATGFHIQH